MSERGATTFVLVHGAWHTGRVWDGVSAELSTRGVGSIAPDLPIESDRACADAYAECIAGAADGLNGDIVVVGHTSACLALPLMPELMPVAGLVYVNPLLPQIGTSFSDQMAAPTYELRDDLGRRYDREARSYWIDREAFHGRLAADCSDVEVERLWLQLRRQARCPMREVTPLKNWPETPSRAIVYTDDADLPVEWISQCVEERLGVSALELTGSQLGFVADPVRFVDALLEVPRAGFEPA